MPLVVLPLSKLDMLVIGLTGSIGTGKSEVARLLVARGAALINADEVGHDAYTPNSELWREVVANFGDGILQPSGEIDRKKLGGIVFSDPDKLTQLNQIMHPRMARMVKERIQSLEAEGVSVVVVEAALLFEAGWNSLVDEVWVTESPTDMVVERIQARNGLGKEEVRKRIDSQMSPEERNSRADLVLDNSGNVQLLEETVSELWDTRVKGRIEQR